MDYDNLTLDELEDLEDGVYTPKSLDELEDIELDW